MSNQYLQYFTDPGIVELALKPISHEECRTIIDPAMGDGAFLRQCKQIWPKAIIFGVDLDRSLVEKLRSEFRFSDHLIAGNSLYDDTFHKGKMKQIVQQGGFDLVVGNPPFSRQLISDQTLLRIFEIVGPPRDDRYPGQSCEVLFVEQFLKLCKPGGYIVIVLPNGLLCNTRDLPVRKFILERTDLLEVLNVPSSIFNGTDARTAVLILRKKKRISGIISPRTVKLRNLEKQPSGLSLNGYITIEQRRLLERMDYNFHNPSFVQLVMPHGKSVVIKPLSQLVSQIVRGHTEYGARRKFSKRGGLRYISSKTITATGVDFTKELRYVRPGSAMDRVTARVKRHNLLFVRVGDGCIGRVTVIRDKGDAGIANDCIFIIKTKGISPYYVALILQSTYGKQWLERLGQHSTGAKNISKKYLLQCPIPIVRDEKARNNLVRKYQRSVLDLHLRGLAEGLNGDQQSYRKLDFKAKQNLVMLLNMLDGMIASSGTSAGGGRVRVRKQGATRVTS